jgi:ribonuclease VapC
MKFVLDSSAVLAFYNDEPGSIFVENIEGELLICAVNYSEVETKLYERGHHESEIETLKSTLPCEVITFDIERAKHAAKLRLLTRHKGLSLGDRACLALAIQQNATVLTTDRAWAELNLGVNIELIR